MTQGDDRRSIWNDLEHLEAAIWRELHALYHENPPPWQRLTRQQLQGLQTRMTNLTHKLRGYRISTTDEQGDH